MMYCLDGRNKWWRQLRAACGTMPFKRISKPSDVDGEGYLFARPTADPMMKSDQIATAIELSDSLTCIQDRLQLSCYDNKVMQFHEFGHWMPETLFSDEPLQDSPFGYPVVSKSAEGSSSANVRIIRDADELRSHVADVFGDGLDVLCGPGLTKQRGYLLLQRFIPHDTTWRVNRVGDDYAAFARYCYPDRPVAQTGNVDPVMRPDDKLLEFAKSVTEDLGTRWVALDILREGHEFRLLETSLAWPHPSPGRCDEAPFVVSGRPWRELFELLVQQIEEGQWRQ